MSEQDENFHEALTDCQRPSLTARAADGSLYDRHGRWRSLFSFIAPFTNLPKERVRDVEEAAMDLGSRPWVLKDVTLPIISPAILAGWLLAFTLSLDDVVITNFTTGPGTTTLPILIWSKVKLGVTPDINALASLTVLVVAISVALAGYMLHRAEKRRENEIQAAIAANT
jgi:ABC-type Fe3+ transport system permease subunit